MPLSRSRDYLSIGEVLEAIKEDFPDVSISKIRFLESEGLISPERTGSGYRKFFEPDLQRLRFILTLQRDQFLPLKVIRERLAQVDANGGAPPEIDPAPAPQRSKRAGKKGSTGAEAAAHAPVGDAPAPDLTGVSMSRDELRRTASLSEQDLKGLEDFGVLREPDGQYDEFDLMIAKAAGRLFQYGVEPRHLRMYRQFADREAAFFDQIVTPVARKRDPEGRKAAVRSMNELVGLGRQMREGVLRSTLRESL